MSRNISRAGVAAGALKASGRAGRSPFRLARPMTLERGPMKKSGHWMPLYWSDYFGDTTCLSTEEHGAYLLLIGAYWQRGRALPDDDSFLSTASRLSRKRWRIMRPKISEYFAVLDGAWRHERVEKELLRSCNRIAAASANAYARWDADGMLPTSTKKQVSKKEEISGFSAGKKNGVRAGVTIADPAERLARFQKLIAEGLGRDGYMIVGAASDPQSPEFGRCLALCKAQATKMNKGWPRQWPI